MRKSGNFAKDEISYVGHILSGEGLKADPEKIRAVQNMNSPQNKKEIPRVHSVYRKIYPKPCRCQQTS